mmetsp:Transcript_5386/g.15100  ORF Transcript_5386/g.15100 Transcript_5386/m.15100 type:complete len:282 (+) Transcript_5386:103-948(+)
MPPRTRRSAAGASCTSTAPRRRTRMGNHLSKAIMNLDIDGDCAVVEGVGDAVSHVPADPPRDEGHAGFLGSLQVRGEGRAARRVGPERAAVAARHDEEHCGGRDALLRDRRERVDVLDGAGGDDLFTLRAFLILRAPGEQSSGRSVLLLLGGDTAIDRGINDRLHLEDAVLARTGHDKIRPHVLAARARDLAADLRFSSVSGPNISQHRRPLQQSHRRLFPERRMRPHPTASRELGELAVELALRRPVLGVDGVGADEVALRVERRFDEDRRARDAFPAQI